MDILSEFGIDSGKFVLGGLCKRGHDFEGTGKSLRYVKGTHQCVQCNKESSAENRKRNPEKVKERSQAYYQANKQAALDYSATYYSQHKQQAKEWRQRPEVAEKHRQQSRLYRQNNLEKVKLKNKKWREANKDYISKRGKEWRKLNRDNFLEYLSRYRTKNRKELLEKKREYYYANPEQAKKGRRIRRAREKSAHSVSIPSTHLCERTNQFQQKCAYCVTGDYEHWDHFIPIAKGGSEALGNLVPACKGCNLSKHACDPLEWYSRQPFYSKKQWLKILKILGKTPATYNQIPLL
jgi:hypothetical protein